MKVEFYSKDDLKRIYELSVLSKNVLMDMCLQYEKALNKIRNLIDECVPYDEYLCKIFNEIEEIIDKYFEVV